MTRWQGYITALAAIAIAHRIGAFGTLMVSIAFTVLVVEMTLVPWIRGKR